MHLYRSNRAERLADALAAVLREPLDNPFSAETLVVQGRGMEVWLNLELSKRLGIFANGEFSFPRNFLNKVVDQVLERAPGAGDTFASREQLVWSLLAALSPPSRGARGGALLEQPGFERLAMYVGDDPTGIRRYQLCEKVAATFDQYLLYRPELLRDWAHPQRDVDLPVGDRWQPLLWRALPEELRQAHLAALEPDVLRILGTAPAGSFPGLPQRTLVFGLSSMPPLYVRILAAAARHTELHLFLLSPTPHYWADLCLPSDPGVVPEPRSAGGRLLASLGQLGAEFQYVLSSEQEALAVAETEPAGNLFLAPDADGPRAPVLAQLQRSLLDLDEGAELDLDHLATDESLRIHSCHSPMREIEVLHDQLLALLTDPSLGLEPRDIVVMTPDIEAFAPLIEAVFERASDDALRIPYHIADRSVRQVSPVIDAFRRALGLVGSRWSASEVLDLLNLEPVRARFDLTPEEVDTLSTWVVESGVRWGIDAEHRSRHDQPAFRENTWRFGLDRLLLGYAMSSDGRQLFAGALPYDEVEGQQALLAGKLASFVESLFAHFSHLESSRSARQWQAALSSALSALVALNGDNDWEAQRVLSVLESLVEESAAAGFEEGELSLDVIRELIDGRLDAGYPARGFLQGGVTFCAMVPMRSIPFEVVALVGLSDGAFPRADRPIDFDLMARKRRAGDRSRRADDRYLFLEAAVSARQRLLVTYTGQSIRDNSLLPPSVVVSELLDHIANAANPGELTPRELRDQLARQLVLRHPLQPFSPRYFDGREPRLFSFDIDLAAGAQQGLTARAPAAPFFSAPLEPDPELMTEPRHVSLRDLIAFVERPAAFLLLRRLGLYLRNNSVEVQDREPIELDPLEQFQVGDAMLQLRLDGVQNQQSLELLRASGRVPLGTVGECTHTDISLVSDPIAAAVARERGAAPAITHPLDLELPGWRLGGELPQVHGGRLLRFQFSRLGPRHQLKLWVEHLAACAAGVASESVLIGRAKAGSPDPLRLCRLRHVSAPEQQLQQLLELYLIGTTEPVALFPQASSVYAAEMRKSGDEEKALEQARKTWDGDRSERAYDEHLRRVYPPEYRPDDLPLFGGAQSPPFTELAQSVFQPLLEHLQEGA